MESGETETGSDTNRLQPHRAVPPPLPGATASPPPIQSSPLPYRSAPPKVGWTVVGSYRGPSEWHAANRVLSRNGIFAQMRTSAGDEHGYDLLVIQTEEQWARDLLNRGKTADDQAERPTRGFPVYDPAPTQPDRATSSQISKSLTIEPSTSRAHIPAMPVSYELSDRQKANYTVWIILLWLLMGVVVLLMGLFAIFASTH
jgi:hypothetical protein